MAEARDGAGKGELIQGIRVVADVSGGGGATREGVIVGRDEKGATGLLVGQPSPFEAAPALVVAPADRSDKGGAGGAGGPGGAGAAGGSGAPGAAGGAGGGGAAAGGGPGTGGASGGGTITVGSVASGGRLVGAGPGSFGFFGAHAQSGPLTGAQFVGAAGGTGSGAPGGPTALAGVQFGRGGTGGRGGPGGPGAGGKGGGGGGGGGGAAGAPAPDVPVIGRAIVIDPGAEILEPGTPGRAARMRGFSTVFQQAGGLKDGFPLGQGLANHAFRIVGKYLAFLADSAIEKGGGGWLCWGEDQPLTRIADFWMSGRGPRPPSDGLATMTREEAAAADAAAARPRTIMRADALVEKPNDLVGLPLALDEPPPGTAAESGRVGSAESSAAARAQNATTTYSATPDGFATSSQVVADQVGATPRERKKFVGWFTSEDGKHWRPAVEFDYEIPPTPPPGGGAGAPGPRGPQGPQGPQGPAGPGAGEQRKDGPPVDVEDPDESPGTDEQGDGELTPCNQEEPGRDTIGDDHLTPNPTKGGLHLPPTPPGGWAEFLRRLREEERRRREREKIERANPGLAPSPVEAAAAELGDDGLRILTALLSAPPGTRGARLVGGDTAIQPKEPPGLYDGDVRAHLGGGPYMRGAPLYPRGGARLITAMDFRIGHTTNQALTFLADRINELVSFLNERFPFAPNAITGGGLRLPIQTRAAVEERIAQFDEGSIVTVAVDGRKASGSREKRWPTPHVVTRDASGKRVLSPISPDRAATRTLGTGERGADVELRFATGYPEHRARGVRGDPQPKVKWNGRDKLFDVEGANLRVEALVAAAADGSESKVETSESTGAVTIKSTPAGGVEITRTLAPRTGDVIQAPSALTSDVLPRADSNGDIVDAGVKDDGTTLATSRTRFRLGSFTASSGIPDINKVGGITDTEGGTTVANAVRINSNGGSEGSNLHIASGTYASLVQAGKYLSDYGVFRSRASASVEFRAGDDYDGSATALLRGQDASTSGYAGGATTVRGGSGKGTGAGGAMTSRAGDSDGAGAGGAYTTRPGNSASGTPGDWKLQTGGASDRLVIQGSDGVACPKGTWDVNIGPGTLQHRRGSLASIPTLAAGELYLVTGA